MLASFIFLPISERGLNILSTAFAVMNLATRSRIMNTVMTVMECSTASDLKSKLSSVNGEHMIAIILPFTLNKGAYRKYVRLEPMFYLPMKYLLFL